MTLSFSLLPFFWTYLSLKPSRIKPSSISSFHYNKKISFTESLIDETLAVAAEPVFRYRDPIKKFLLTVIEALKKHNLKMTILESTDPLHLHKNIKKLTYV
ncbi:hypothetical protein RMATCC62417_10773 [Rhizopus microsporus]|nr:hypothetical protein RMATCC62417_10773 [Rhizopus microsporus]